MGYSTNSLDMELLMFIGTLIGELWMFFTRTQFFSLGFTFAQLFIFIVLANGTIRLIGMAFGLGSDGTMSGGNGKNIRIKDKRKGDEK